ncbi:MAG: insulinase family protein [Cytophagaceae bacterium]|jgi:zinc protease|nr:insulinase family protein [Cytophagaceae bacterium]
MIEFSQFTLDNGLQVIVHTDTQVNTFVLNVLYDVGSRDEHPDKTGFAHLFEHLMFGGSKHISAFDEPLQRAGGENNAFTSPDITNYYITIPAQNKETAFWLESDRMLSLSFDPKVLEVQRQVVIEEFKQRYLNQPYGDVWLKLRPLAYTQHGYRWPTIGKEIRHIENATLQDVKDFFYTYYVPSNAYLVLAGNITLEEAKRLSEKWFGPIPGGKKPVRNIPIEPKQTTARFLETSGNVPLDALYKTYPMCGKNDAAYYATDCLSDIVGRGKSSLLYQQLVQEKKYFNSIQAYVMGSIDPGLLVIDGKLNKGVSLSDGDNAIQTLLEDIMTNGIGEKEISKAKNQAESTLVFGEVEILNRAMNLAFAAVTGNPESVNQEAEKIQNITSSEVNSIAKEIFQKENCSTLWYKATNSI